MRANGFLLLLAVLAGSESALAASPVGLVLLHGKTETPKQLAKLTAALVDAGYTVEVPEMCWASPAVAGDRLIIRTTEHLYAVGNKPARSP